MSSGKVTIRVRKDADVETVIAAIEAKGWEKSSNSRRAIIFNATGRVADCIRDALATDGVESAVETVALHSTDRWV